jgi:hypothetical protein
MKCKLCGSDNTLLLTHGIECNDCGHTNGHHDPDENAKWIIKLPGQPLREATREELEKHGKYLRSWDDDDEL